MRVWLSLLAGPVAWAAHFVALYAIVSLLPGQSLARWPILAVTLPAVILGLIALRRTIAAHKELSAGLDRWLASLRVMALALSLIAICYQGAIGAF